MTAIIYSKKKIDGLQGINGFYANPALFNGDTENCDIVYTDDAKIREAYESKSIEVKAIPQNKPKVEPKPKAVKAKPAGNADMFKVD